MSEQKPPAPKPGRSRPSFLRLVLSPTLITDEVLNYSYHGKGTAEEPYIVDWVHEDPRNPLDWSPGFKWLITMIMSLSALALTLSSTNFAAVSPQIRHDFNISTTLSIGTVSFFVLGFSFGGMAWGPMSEVFGRQIIYAITFFFMTLFGGISIASPNVQTLFVMRFLAGLFGSSSISNAGAVISDIFATHERGLAIMVYTSAPFLGPSLGPLVSGFLGQAGGWKWADALGVILGGVVLVLGVMFVPETYTPYLLTRRAKGLSKLTGKVYLSKLDIGKTITLQEITQKAVIRPWAILLTEPVALTLSIYAAIVYGILYLSFTAFPIVFVGERGWSQGVSGLAYLGIMVGQITAMVTYVFLEVRFRKKIAKDPSRATPEARLDPALIGAVALPVGLFWFAWTTYPHIHWIVSIIGSSIFGFGQVLLFISLINYVVDTYSVFAASALASSAVLRALFGAAFPLFTPIMYENLGTQWASSIPAFLGLVCAPLPFIFYVWGETLRGRSKYATEAMKITNNMLERRVEANLLEVSSDATGVVPAEATSDEEVHNEKV